MNQDVVFALCGVLMFMTPIIFILTRHQQTMARILRENQSAPDQDVRSELEHLKQIVVQQTLALDSLADEHRKLLSHAPSSVRTLDA